MIILRSIHLTKFKGIEDLTCDLNDLTVLVGLNNTGKTTVLQAIYLLISSLPSVTQHTNLAHHEITARPVDMNPSVARLGLPGFDWLLQGSQTPFKITGTFHNGCIINIEMVGRGRFCFSVQAENIVSEHAQLVPFVEPLKTISAEFFRPPGLLAPRETMLPGPEYKNQLSQGRGNQHWRNAIWWTVQNAGGSEGFEPVRKMVTKHFPDVTLQQPILADTENPPPILIGYRESNGPMLDIAQSGGGLHTFLALAQITLQSKANVLLLDEPDSHLHASQQAIVVELLTRIAFEDDRQVILATHSPEIMTRVPPDSILWLERGCPQAQGGMDAADMLDRLGASPGVYLSMKDFPSVIVYVEGNDDKPILERLIAWCRAHSQGPLPSAQVIRHKDGKFPAAALQGITRTLSELNRSARVVGIRDLDWEYEECPPPNQIGRTEGNGYMLLTLPCKELENMFCDPEFIFQALDKAVSRATLQTIVEEESMEPKLVNDLRYHAEPQIRNRFGAKEAEHTKESKAEQEFNRWSGDAGIRARLVSGKQLLGRIRDRLKRDHKARLSSTTAFDRLKALPHPWDAIATDIFPEFVPQITQIAEGGKIG